MKQIFAILLLSFVASLSYADTITYNTLGSTFVSSGTNVLTETSGSASTLVYTPDANTTVGVPTNINEGAFVLSCLGCGVSGSASYDPFTFDLQFNDVTTGAVGVFVGTSAGGTVTSNSSNIDINWAPLQLGPGTNNATSGDFGNDFVTTETPTLIVAPNVEFGVLGVTTQQGTVDATPEPTTFALIGTSLFGLAALARKFFVKI